MRFQQTKTQEPIEEVVKRNLKIHTYISFGLLMAPMLISLEWWPIISPFVAGLWFFILLKMSGRLGLLSRILMPVSLSVIALSVLCGTVLALDLSIHVFERVRIWFTLFGTLVPILMFFSVFFLFFVYRKRL